MWREYKGYSDGQTEMEVLPNVRKQKRGDGMTKEEAIKILRHWGSNTPATDRDCAVKMAIEALENPEPHWIPVTERLPEPRIDVWCNSDLGQMVGYYDETIETWFGRDYLELLVNAWMPLPEPFKGVTK